VGFSWFADFKLKGVSAADTTANIQKNRVHKVYKVYKVKSADMATYDF
jgi:hypothetical protein